MLTIFFCNNRANQSSPRDAVCYSAVYAVVMCPPVCLSVRLPQAGTVPKQLSIGLRKQRRTTAHGFQFSDTKDFGEIPTGSPQRGSQI